MKRNFGSVPFMFLCLLHILRASFKVYHFLHQNIHPQELPHDTQDYADREAALEPLQLQATNCLKRKCLSVKLSMSYFFSMVKPYISVKFVNVTDFILLETISLLKLSYIEVCLSLLS